MLADRDIRALLDSGRLVIDPLKPDRIQPASVDLTLGDQYRSFDRSLFRRVRLSAIPDDLTELHDGSDGIVLEPGRFLLATTAETVTLPDDVCGILHGRSTLGRLGLTVHVTAGLIDPGFAGHITLEVVNVGDLHLELWPGDVIGQLTLHPMSSPCQRPYGSAGLGSHYQHQRGPTPPRSGAG
ncbi:dCTP deaminase [Pseudonocardia hispaniensis]|uniref:dCTP deaminase n=1 Tax=Pseudonocardia hispaniensis TaxID=904933 RepID=A0ABW1J8I7_9PSEU